MHINQPLYNQILSVMPIVCVDVAIVYHSRILLIKRNQEPAKDEWWLPGGRLYKNETFGQCALRKAIEETGLSCAADRVVHYQSTIFDTVHSVNFCYLLYANSDDVKLDHTASNCKWVGDITEVYHPYVMECLSKALWEVRTRLVVM